MRFHSATSSLYMLSITICLVMIKLLHIHYFIMQVLFKISKQKYIVIIYPFYDVLYEVNIHCFLLSIQITVVSALSMYSTKSSMREELSPLISPRLGSDFCIILSKHFQVAVVPSSFLNDPISYSIARCFS